MTKEEFRNLSIGDIVILNGRCRGNKGVRCVVDYIIDDRMHVHTLERDFLLIGRHRLTQIDLMAT